MPEYNSYADNEVTTTCPICGDKGEIQIHPDGRMCGCLNCLTVFRYPSMEEFPTTRQAESKAMSYRWSVSAEYLNSQPYHNDIYPY